MVNYNFRPSAWYHTYVRFGVKFASVVPLQKIHRQVRSSAPSCGPLHIYKQNSDFSHHTHGTVFLSQLEMHILEAHRKQARLIMIRRITHGMLEVSPTTASAVPGIAISNQFSKQQPESLIVLCPSQWRLGTRTVSGPATSKSSQWKPLRVIWLVTAPRSKSMTT